MPFESVMYQHKSENCAINYPNVVFGSPVEEGKEEEDGEDSVA